MNNEIAYVLMKNIAGISQVACQLAEAREKGKQFNKLTVASVNRTARVFHKEKVGKIKLMKWTKLRRDGEKGSRYSYDFAETMKFAHGYVDSC